MSAGKTTFVLVGHAESDAAGLTKAIKKLLGDVPVEAVDDESTLTPLLAPQNVLLINRVLDYGFPTASGIELVKELRAGENIPAMMIVSDAKDAQTKAVEAGALPGFGKKDAGTELMKQRLRAAMGR